MNALPASAIPHRSSLIIRHFFAAAALAAALGGCGTFSSRPSAPEPPGASKSPPSPAATRPGGYYLDDGPGANPPSNLDDIPDAVPRPEPLRRANSRPYVALGVSYRPMTEIGPYKARGLATWYGRRYHGKPTASGELYDMYAMTGAHAVLPIPSYARVTNLKNGKSVVVRINDRGPFVDGRLIDVSYTAAHKLGILGGATMVEVESIVPSDSGPGVVAVQEPPPVPPRQQPVPVAATQLPATDHPDAGPAAARPPRPAETASAPPAVQPAVAVPAVAAPSAPTPGAGPDGAVYLQLGAFGSRQNAESLLTRLKAQADWLTLQIVSLGGLHRLRAGPYANASEARQAAERINQALGIRPVVQAK